MPRLSQLCSSLLVLSLAPLALADALEDAEKALIEAHTKLKSFSAKYTTRQDMTMGEGNSMKSDSSGTMDWLRRGDKVLFRVDMKGSAVQKFGGQENKSEQTLLLISDGEYVHTLMEANDQKMVYKQKADPISAQDIKATFSAMRESYNLALLPDEKVDGADCCVVEGTAKDAAADGVAKERMFFRKDLGLLVRSVGMDKAGKVVTETNTTDLKPNAELKADRFEFKTPEGVQVMDMTQSQPAQNQAP